MSDERLPTIEGTRLDALACNLTALDALPSDVVAKAATVTECGLQFNALTGAALAGLAQFPATETLLLDNNEIESLRALPSLPQLHTLWLNNNELAALDDVVLPLARSCPRLLYLSLLRNPCCPNELMGKGEAEYRRYRLYVKFRIPTLQYLDAAPFSAEDVKEARERGAFLATATAARPSGAVTVAASSGDGGAAEATAEGTTEGAAEGDVEEPDFFAAIEARERTKMGGLYFTQQKHFYSGKASEGNRFIKDDVL